MTVRHVFAQADIRDDQKIFYFRFDRAGRAAAQYRRQPHAPLAISSFVSGSPKKNDGGNSK